MRAAGKDVWLYSDSYSNATALLGSAANRFTLMPEGDVSFSGIYSESMYYKGQLDKAGVVADVIHIGDFKSFGEEYYRDAPSDFAKQQKEELIGAIYDQIVTGVAEGRKVPAEKIRELVDLGTFSPQQAKAAGLVDELKHRTDFSAAVKAAYEGAEFDRGYELPDLEGPEIDGMMDIIKLISEVLWEATDEWKASGRPFVVAMGGVAASGGYYISSGADRIFAEEGTVTGSIGVVGKKMVLGGAMEKLGISTHATQRGKNAGAQSMTRPFSAEESKLVRDSMLQVYGTFKKRIESGRGERLKGELEGMAGGRVFTGSRALELGLVDELGGLGEAIAHAAEKCGVDADAIRLVPEPKGAFDGLFAAPEEPREGEIVRMGTKASPAADALLATLGEAQLAGLPKPAREAVARVLERIESCSDSTIQLIGPDIRIPLD